MMNMTMTNGVLLNGGGGSSDNQGGHEKSTVYCYANKSPTSCHNTMNGHNIHNDFGAVDHNNMKKMMIENHNKQQHDLPCKQQQQHRKRIIIPPLIAILISLQRRRSTFYISAAFLCLLAELLFLSRLSQFSSHQHSNNTQIRQPLSSSSLSSTSSSSVNVQVIPQIPPFQEQPIIKSQHKNQQQQVRREQQRQQQHQHLVQNSNNNKNVTAAVDWQALSKELSTCTLPPKPQQRRELWERNDKPILISSYPFASATEATGAANFDMIRPLITGITGLKQGAKNFHSTSKSLKRCHTHKTETVTCSNVHPIFNIQPDKLTHQFDRNVVISIRNFATAFPMSLSLKNNRYNNNNNNGGGQESIDSWRKNRDEFIESAFANWKSIIVDWKKQVSLLYKHYYRIYMYLPYEYMMDPVQGPSTVLRLAKLLNASHFPSALFDSSLSSPPTFKTNTQSVSDEQRIRRIQEEEEETAQQQRARARCVWFKSVANAQAFEQGYMTYIPGYRTAQRDYMLQQMQQMQNEFRDDVELVRLLKLYHQQIRDETVIDDDDDDDNDPPSTTTTTTTSISNKTTFI